MNLIMVVEDDADIMAVTSMLLEDEGYEVLQASQASEALAFARQHPEIDVVFTDVNLREGVNGIELARDLKAQGSQASMIVVSGDLGWAHTRLDADMRFLAKPYTRKDLIEAVSQACSRHHA
ncbi:MULTISPECIES: response regulator [Dyella]|uniref:Response regulator n=2 Tax=Dyella TaxID=231454 RepID=A0A4R0YU43_9GAMM|nr:MULTISPECIES: response regulator [Dyella]TBR39492.1 response regulator [Dyella terrae]TCI12923.1 response regulator [Dyella soli]